MVTQKELNNAKKAIDKAWAEATKSVTEAIQARRMLDAVPARDTDHAFHEKVMLTERAYANWRKAAAEGARVLEELRAPVDPRRM